MSEIEEDIKTDNFEEEQSYSFFSLVFLSPLNLALLFLCFYLLYKIIKMKQNAEATKNLLPPLKKQDFTLAQLKEMNGQNGRLLLAINGKVFDVTNGSKDYGPSQPYGRFAGHDASRGLATFSLNSDAIRETYDDLCDLTPGQMDKIREWELQFQDKYPIVGRLLKPGEEPLDYTDISDDELTRSKIE